MRDGEMEAAVTMCEKARHMYEHCLHDLEECERRLKSTAVSFPNERRGCRTDTPAPLLFLDLNLLEESRKNVGE